MTRPTTQRLVHTYSILARDPETGDLGVAVQSHWPGIGAQVAWARAGVGVVATQAAIRPEYGPAGLDQLEVGVSAKQAFLDLSSVDPDTEARQVALLGPTGRPFVHTGSGCIPDAGHLVEESFSVQGNFLASPAVLPAMVQGFLAAKGPLGERLLTALEAAEVEGGDLRGRQAAAVLVVPENRDGTGLDLRVDDHIDPLQELARLLRMRRGYDEADEAGALARAGCLDAAVQRFERAMSLAPESIELRFWFGVALLSGGFEAEAGLRLAAVVAEVPRWRGCLQRLPGTSAMPAREASRRQVERVLSKHGC